MRVKHFVVEVSMQKSFPHRRERQILAALPVTLYLFLCVLYLFAIPPGESPDEPSHLQCIEQVSILNRLPIVDPPPRGLWWTRERVISGLTCYHLPLYYLVAGYTQSVLAHLTGAPLHYEFPPTDTRFATGASVAMFIHEPRSHFLTLREPITLTALRIEASLLGLGMLWATYRLARRLAPDLLYGPILAMTLTAGWPQFVFMSRAINNDTLAVALAVVALAVMVSSDRPSRYVVASVLMVAAVFAKLMMAFAVVALALSWTMELLWSSSISHRRRLAFYGLICLAIFAVPGMLLILQPTLNGHVQATVRGIASANPAAQTTVYWANVFRTTLQSGWGRFGWMNLATPDGQVYAWWVFLTITILIGVFYVVRRARDAFDRETILLCVFWVVGALAVYGQIQMNRFQPQFRYAFAILPILTAFSGIGISVSVGRAARLQRLMVLLLSVLLFAVNLWIVCAVLMPAYP